MGVQFDQIKPAWRKRAHEPIGQQPRASFLIGCSRVSADHALRVWLETLARCIVEGVIPRAQERRQDRRDTGGMIAPWLVRQVSY